MSDQTDSPKVEAEVQDAKPEPSPEPKGDAADSLDATRLVQSILSNKEATELMRRQFQSDKDRGVAKALNEAAEAKDMYQQIAERLGLDQNQLQQAQREVFLDNLMASGLQQPEAAAPVPDNNGMLSGDRAWEAASSILGGVSAEMQQQIRAQMATKQFTDAQAVQAFAVTTIANISAQPSANPAAAIAPAGGGGSVSPDIDSLQAELDALTEKKDFRNPRRKEIIKAMEELEQSN